MSYIDEGAGDPILLLHGNGTWSYLWRNVIPHLRGLGRIVAPDLIGMGRSDKPQLTYGFFDHAGYLEELILQLDLTKITLVVHDWGSGLGFHFARRHPERIKAFVMMESLIKPWESWDTFPIRFRDEFQQFRDPAKGWDMIMGRNLFIEGAVPNSQFRPLTAAEMNAYRAPFADDPAHRIPTYKWPNEIPIEGAPADVAHAWAAWQEYMLENDRPKLLLKAEPGAIIDDDAFAWLRARLKNTTFEHIGQGIHYVQEDNPHGVGHAIADWMTEQGLAALSQAQAA
jgi:haloalkane dehalogenase